MAAAYGAFATDGHRVTAVPVTRILAADGTEPVALPRRGPGKRVVSVDTARLVTAALQENVRSGTATRAAIDHPVAAKTGTSNDYGNAWLAGYSGYFSTAVWVGFREGNVPMRDVAGVSRVTGGSLPTAIWHDVMATAHGGRPVIEFPPAPDRPPLRTLAAIDDGTLTTDEDPP
jgi:penicillin-binding protein 1A